MLNESQNVEYKETWRDEYLKWICGFANAQGGRIYIGVNDKKEVVGVGDPKRLMEDIPNKVRDVLGIIVDVNLLSDEGKGYLEIVVEPCNVPISYRGQYHYRSGSTKQELKGVALQQFILKKMGMQWDDVLHETATIDCIDERSIRYLVRKGIEAGRITDDSMGDGPKEVLENLGLVSEDGKLKYAAILLFCKCPQRYFTGIQFKIGRFGADETDLMFQDVVEGNILQMADEVIHVLKAKYLISPIHYEGMQRKEPLEIPEDAFREIIYIAIIHKQYTGAPIQMRVYTDHIELWNDGPLPEGYTVDTLMRRHSSKPRNYNIAEVFYRSGFIKSWGRGIKKICLQRTSEVIEFLLKNESMKKVGLATFFYDDNFGTCLQAFALQHVMEQFGYDVSLIRYHRAEKTQGDRDGRWKRIFQLSPRKTLWWLINRKSILAKKTKFKEFRDRYLNLADDIDYYRNSGLKDVSKKYDALVCGSDMMWSSDFKADWAFYYLSFSEKRKNISYAPSYGRNHLTEQEIAQCIPYINNISHLSCREIGGGRFN